MTPRSTSDHNTACPSSQNGGDTHTSGSPMWKIQEVPGRGKGLVVTQDIAPGICLISEAPLITTAKLVSFDMDINEQTIADALERLPQECQEAYHSLHNNHENEDPKHPLIGIIKSNAYPLGSGNAIGGVFADISRINHSCRPNTIQYYNPILEKQTIYAIRHIPAGEEMTTMYHEGGPSSVRKALLKDRFGFDCACEVCSLPRALVEQSDERLDRATAMDKIIGDTRKCHNAPDAVMASCRELFAIYSQEDINDGRLARLYYDCFQLCVMHGDLARGRCFAKYYCDVKKMSEGQDSLNYLETRPFVKNPQKHDIYDPTMQSWKTAAGDVPKRLNANDFAKWLWREEV